MMKIIATFLLTQALVALGAWSVLLSNEKLDCAGVKIYSIDALQTDSESPCGKISLLVQKDSQSSLGNSELIHDCLCNLINRPIVWTSLVDEPLEFIMKDILSPKINGDTADEETFLRRVDKLKSGKSGNLHWAILDSFQKNYPLKLYNEGADFKVKTPFKEPLDLLASSCMRLNKLFQNVERYLSDAAQLTKNNGLSYKLMKYDADLFKVFLMNKVCHELIHNTPE